MSTPERDEVWAALPEKVREVADVDGPHRVAPDALRLRIKPVGSSGTWSANARAANAALDAAGLRVERDDLVLWVRLPVSPGRLGVRETERSGRWTLVDHHGAIMGAVWRERAGEDPGERFYRVGLNGFPPNPRSYRTRHAAVVAAEGALAHRSTPRPG